MSVEPGGPALTGGACELCGAEAGPDGLAPLAGLGACEICRTGDPQAAIDALGYEAELRQYHAHSAMGGGGEDVVQVDIQRPPIGLEIEMSFSRQKGPHGWFARLMKKEDLAIGLAEFDDYVRIKTALEFEQGVQDFLRSAGARAAILWLVGNRCSVSMVGRSMSAGARQWNPDKLPALHDVARYATALGIHLDRFGQTGGGRRPY